MTATATQTTSTATAANRALVLRAFAVFAAPGRVDASALYADDVEFVGPARGLWTASRANAEVGPIADPCFEIERIEVDADRVVTHATPQTPSGREARALFVHTIAGGRIASVSSLLRWS